MLLVCIIIHVAVTIVAGGQFGEDLRAFYVPSGRTRSMVV